MTLLTKRNFGRDPTQEVYILAIATSQLIDTHPIGDISCHDKSQIPWNFMGKNRVKTDSPTNSQDYLKFWGSGYCCPFPLHTFMHFSSNFTQFKLFQPSFGNFNMSGIKKHVLELTYSQVTLAEAIVLQMGLKAKKKRLEALQQPSARATFLAQRTKIFQIFNRRKCMFKTNS